MLRFNRKMFYKSSLKILVTSPFSLVQLLLVGVLLCPTQVQGQGLGAYNPIGLNDQIPAHKNSRAEIKAEVLQPAIEANDQAGITGTKPADATVIQGINTAETVRVRGCGLASLEALLNIFANGTELIGIGFGASILLLALQRLKKNTNLSKPRIL